MGTPMGLWNSQAGWLRFSTIKREEAIDGYPTAMRLRSTKIKYEAVFYEIPWEIGIIKRIDYHTKAGLN